ncbi:hypothetical protein JHK85_025285 [Glycine max]|nr:hypothetical protein JHK85_025285 [Glycine max]
MSWKENLIFELHTRKGTWKIAARITDLWQVRKQNSKQAIEMVLMDQTLTKSSLMLHGVMTVVLTVPPHLIHRKVA